MNCLGDHGVRNDSLNEAAIERLCRVESSAGNEHFESRGPSDQSRQSLRPSPPGDDAEASAGMGKHRIARRDPRVARERQIESAAEAISANRRDDGLRRIRYRAHHPLTAARKFERRSWREICKLRNLRAGRERALGSANDRAGQLIRSSKLCDLCFDLRQNPALEPRESVVTFEPKQQNFIVPRDRETAAHLRD